ncbi:MAG: M28 family peptidase [bacterium]|nr:M28 family peptidase [bacterium]
MNKKYLLFFILVFLLLTTAGSRITGIEKDKKIFPSLEKRLYSHVLFLTSITPPRYHANPGSLNKAASYIFAQFEKCGGRTVFQPFKAKGKNYKNVIASFGPEKGERIILGAHYDVCGAQPGADDNGSGVATLLELARMIAQNKPNLKYRLDLASYTLEEPPFYRSPFMGSAIHADSLAKANVKVKLMISIDMIGYFPENPTHSALDSELFKFYNIDPSNATVLMSKTDMKDSVHLIRKYICDGSTIDVLPKVIPRSTRGSDWSDHLNFWNNGYPGMLLCNAFINPSPNYHKKSDTIDTLNFQKIAEIAKGLYHTIITIEDK